MRIKKGGKVDDRSAKVRVLTGVGEAGKKLPAGVLMLRDVIYLYKYVGEVGVLFER